MAIQQASGFWQTEPGESQYGLSLEHKRHNANLVYQYFIRYWSKKAVCAMLGNMEKESRQNPIVQRGNAWGLVQWKPYTKLTNFCDRYGIDWREGSSQLFRIYREWERPDLAPQWRPMETGVSFYEWSQMEDETLERMTNLFRYCYETADPDPDRVTWAQYYYDNLPLFNKLIIPCLSKNRRRGVIKYG